MFRRPSEPAPTLWPRPSTPAASPSSAPARARGASASGWSTRCSARQASSRSGWSTPGTTRWPAAPAIATCCPSTPHPTWCCSASVTVAWSSSSPPPRTSGPAAPSSSAARTGTAYESSSRRSRAMLAWRSWARAAWASGTSGADCAPWATPSETTCRPGRCHWSPTPARCSPRCCARGCVSASTSRCRRVRSW